MVKGLAVGPFTYMSHVFEFLVRFPHGYFFLLVLLLSVSMLFLYEMTHLRLPNLRSLLKNLEDNYQLDCVYLVIGKTSFQIEQEQEH